MSAQEEDAGQAYGQDDDNNIEAHLRDEEPQQEENEDDNAGDQTEGKNEEDDTPEAMKAGALDDHGTAGGSGGHQEARDSDAPGTRIFLGGISGNTTEEGLKTFFSQHANVLRVEIPRDRETGRQKAFAFLTAASEADAAKLVGKTFEIDGRPVDARQSKRKEETVTKSRKIFIGGTPPSTTENDVQTFFSKFGEIEGIEIPGEKDGRPRGFAFITFTTIEAADKCRAAGRFQEFMGKRVEVKDATPKSQSVPTGGRGGAGGRGMGMGYGYGYGMPYAQMGMMAPYGMMGYGMQPMMPMAMAGMGMGGAGGVGNMGMGAMGAMGGAPGMYGGMYWGYGGQDSGMGGGVGGGVAGGMGGMGGAGMGGAGMGGGGASGGRYHPYGGGAGMGGGAARGAPAEQPNWYAGRR